MLDKLERNLAVLDDELELLEEIDWLDWLLDDMLVSVKEDTLVSLVSKPTVLVDEDELLIDSSISANKRIESVGCKIKGPVVKIFLLVEAVAEVKAILTPLIVAVISYCLSIVPRLKSSPIE